MTVIKEVAKLLLIVAVAIILGHYGAVALASTWTPMDLRPPMVEVP
jgi:uncharacterized phage infection (PIP) family protein YhgE